MGVTPFAAFLDVHVVRKGAGGRLSRCNAILHPHDCEGYKMLQDGHPLPLENDPKVIRRGIHLQVGTQQARVSVSMGSGLPPDGAVAPPPSS